MKKNVIWLAIIICFHLFLLLTLQFTAWPEMLIYPHLLINGFSYYGDIIQPYFPTLPFLLTAIYKIFGISVNTLRFVTYVITIISDVLLFVILTKSFKIYKWFIIFFGFLYVVLQVLLEGNGLWFDNATLPFLLLAFLFWLKFKEKKSETDLIFSALLLGIAFIIKQTSIWIILFLTFYLLSKRKWKQTALFSLCAGLPFLSLLIMSNPSDVWYWDIYYPFLVMSSSPGYLLFPTLKQVFTSIFIFSPLIFLFLKRDKKIIDPFVWLIAAVLFIIPRFAYFHLQPALPFFIICLSLLLEKFQRNIRIPVIALYLIGIGFLMVRFSIYLPYQPVRFFEPHVYETTTDLRNMLGQDKNVFFYNDMGNVMVAGGFIPPKPWSANFPWYMELPGLQEKMIQSLEIQKIKSVIMIPFGNEGVFVPGSYKPKLLDAYIQSNFHLYQKINSGLDLLTRN